MIFGKPLDRLVLEGRKTQTRRRVKAARDGGIVPCRYVPGRDYAVQGRRGGAELARIEILDVRREPVGAITYPDARAEGFRTTAAFADYWMRLYDRGWPPTEPCPSCDGDGMIGDGTRELTPSGETRVPCLACGGDHDTAGTGQVERDTDDDEILERFGRSHAATIVWVVTFRLHEAPRLLAARPSSAPEHGAPRDTDHGYTTNPARAMTDEPEAIDAELLNVYTQDAHQRYAGQPGRREERLRREVHALNQQMRQIVKAGGSFGDLAEQLATKAQHLRELERQHQDRAA